MTNLSVNVNKIATLRNARGADVPSVTQVAIDCERFGADGITIHPRPDERHITKKDVYELKEVVTTEFNIEGYPNERFMQLIQENLPDQATLVPDPPGVLTSNAGWDTIKHKAFLQDICDQLRSLGVRSSIFIETDPAMIEGAAEVGVDRIELYTGPYADDYHANADKAVLPYVEAAKLADRLNLGINAGHDLNLSNLGFFKRSIPNLLEVSIGHALIADALYLGLEKTIDRYKELLVDRNTIG
jgi:pyridoxine 5-phosphate synthase